MKLFKKIFFLSLLTVPAILRAQSTFDFTLSLIPLYNDSPVNSTGTFYKNTIADSISFETLKFYISGIELSDSEHTVWKEENSFHLIDIFNAKTLSVRLIAPQQLTFNKLKFHLGIDSVTNVSGAMGGDLDPTKGMYWTWQNGYINFKLEGKSNLCKTRNNEFKFHLGGYQFPNNSMQTITLTATSQENIIIRLDLEKFIHQVDLSDENEVMSPGKESIILSKKAASAFSLVK